MFRGLEEKNRILEVKYDTWRKLWYLTSTLILDVKYDNWRQIWYLTSKMIHDIKYDNWRQIWYFKSNESRTPLLHSTGTGEVNQPDLTSNMIIDVNFDTWRQIVADECDAILQTGHSARVRLAGPFVAIATALITAGEWPIHMTWLASIQKLNTDHPRLPLCIPGMRRYDQKIQHVSYHMDRFTASTNCV